MQVTKSMSVLELKQKISEKLNNIKPEEIKVIFRGKDLFHNKRKLLSEMI